MLLMIETVISVLYVYGYDKQNTNMWICLRYIKNSPTPTRCTLAIGMWRWDSPQNLHAQLGFGLQGLAVGTV